MITRLTNFKQGGVYKNRLGEYTVIDLNDDGTMIVYCEYDDEMRIFNILIAQMTIFNLNRGK